MSLLRKEFLYDLEAHHGEHIKVCVFGAASLHGRALGLPRPDRKRRNLLAAADPCSLSSRGRHRDAARRAANLGLLQLRCLGHRFRPALRDARRRLLEGPPVVPGPVSFTIDWYGSEDAEEAGEGGTSVPRPRADNGNFAALPNNCLQWHDPAFVTPYTEKPDFRINTHTWKVEQGGLTTDEFFYESTRSTDAAVAVRADERDPSPHDMNAATTRSLEWPDRLARLYTPVVADVLDKIGFRHQSMHAQDPPALAGGEDGRLRADGADRPRPANWPRDLTPANWPRSIPFGKAMCSWSRNRRGVSGANCSQRPRTTASAAAWSSTARRVTRVQSADELPCLPRRLSSRG